MPAQKRGQAKRDEILAAAAAAFAKNGYDHVSMDDIAEQAHASKRTVYNHFGSKEALFHQLLENLVSQMLSAKKIIFDNNVSLVEQLAAFALAKGSIAQDANALALLRIGLTEAIRKPELMQRIMAHVNAEEDGLVTWLKAAHKAKVVHAPNPQKTAEYFWDLASGVFFWPATIYDNTTHSNNKKLAKQFAEMFLIGHLKQQT